MALNEGAAIAAIGLFFMLYLLFLLGVYLFVSFALYSIAKKTKTENPWLAFIPIGNVVLMTQIGKVHWATIFLVFVPIVGWVVPFYWWWKIAEARNKPGWYALLMMIPLVNFVIIGVIAWKD